MIVIGTEQEINEKIKSLSKEKLLKNDYGKPYYENTNIKFNKSNTMLDTYFKILVLCH